MFPEVSQRQTILQTHLTAKKGLSNLSAFLRGTKIEK
jgi:hypothetical protein